MCLFSEFKRADFFRQRILVDQDVLARKNSFDDLAFTEDDEDRLELTGGGEGVVDEAMAMVRTPEARDLRGYIGHQW